ncbi:hypothetical protein [Metabacillus sediminilitoris]|uniref:RCK C-terminal domain-containing protein n=1 Tax=Metabacillus sediminilitoris TaxID=2567941 RepID=A0A4S4BX55_9BACI|nr:hypothetical protein [Metabacillus sediminilitoris]QGQ46193.1 hypothetical protein GMB29_13785 [Metabacillus sediminilitoris]THF79246.1 hypothetical protein E6W99_12895 [Metabacillus sediminilitoris]
MNILFLLIYFIIIIAVIEIHTILFWTTGLKLEVSRFQVISMMTGTGFTTGESELILGHPIRRKLAIFLILFGAFSLAVIISTISSYLSDDLRTKEIFFVAGGLLLILGILKLSFIQNKLSTLFNEKMRNKIEVIDLPIREVFLLDENDHVLNLHVFKESYLLDKTLNQAIKGHEELEFVILFIKRGDLIIKKHVYNTEIHEGDQIFIFGSKKIIEEKFKKDIEVMEEELKNHTHAMIMNNG